jgi:alpha-N-arabinofuranosidase
MDGNVFLKGAKPCRLEKDPAVQSQLDPAVRLVPKAGGYWLEMMVDKSWAREPPRKIVTGERLGKAATPNLPYEQPDGTPLRLSQDYFGKPRDEANPAAGPFENPGTGPLALKVW